ncbi:MAG: hypothetical protein ACOYM2_16980 [Rectinemataceae bacterium]
MKRISLTLIAFLIVSSLLGAQTVLTSLEVKDARSMAMGGAFTSLGSGYQSFYGNPAGFASGRFMLTLANASTWGYVKPSLDNIDVVTSAISGGTGDTSALIQSLGGLITANGLGAGASAGLGFTGGGWGIGATAVADTYAHGATLLGTSLAGSGQVNFIGGMAVTLGPKDFNLKLGGDIRPFVRVDSSMSVSSLLGSLSGGDPVAAVTGNEANYGLGLVADLGAIMTAGPLAVGLSVRDIGASFNYYSTTLMDLGTAINDPTGLLFTSATFAPDITAGLSFAPMPAFLSWLVDPVAYLEVRDALALLEPDANIWNRLHAGAEIKLLNFIYLRGGLSQGYMSVGGGVDLLILQGDIGVFTEEMGAHPGDQGRSGVAANVRLHF